MKTFLSIARWLALACACLLAACTPHNDATFHFTQAMLLTQTPSIERDTLRAPLRLPPLPFDGWTPVSLPDVRSRPGFLHPLTDAHVAAAWTTRFYKVQSRTQTIAAESLAIYIPRSHPTVGRLSVYVNGALLEDEERQGWNNPYFAAIPRDVASSASGTLDVVIALSLVPHGGGALSPVYIGPAEDLRNRFQLRRFFQIEIPQIANVSFLILGAFALAFWWFRRNATPYALFAAIAAANFFRSLRYSFSDPLQLDGWFWWFTANASGWIIVLGYFLAVRLHARRYPRFERMIIALILAASVATLVMPLLHVLPHTVVPVLYVMQLLIGVAVLVAMIDSARKGRQREGMMIVVAQLLWYAVSLHDGLLQNWGEDIEGIFLSPYGSLLLLGTFLYAILRGYLAAISDAETLNTSLESKLADRTQQLETTHNKLLAVERDQAVSDERQRLMREMHDGLGSALMSSLVLVEQGELDSKSVARVLRESLDDLKLTIDSLEPMGDDLTTLLGTLRYRLGQRLEAAGLILEWQVHDIPNLPWLNPTSALQILRILQETLTNILKHAAATIIRVETIIEPAHVVVRVTDNGRGFDVAAVSAANTGRGLSNLRRRAGAIDAHIDIVSRSGETVVSLQLPRQRIA